MSSSSSRRYAESITSESAVRDLAGYSMWVTFTGFDVENMNFGLELKSTNSEAIFSRGIESSAPGFWRVVKQDGKENVEVTHPVLPEYMYFFDLWEKNLLWRGELDMNNARIVNGQVLANKKRFGLFPYTETVATFEADLLEPGNKLPDVVLPNFADMNFLVSYFVVDDISTIYHPLIRL